MTLIKRVNNNFPVFQNWLDDFFSTNDYWSNREEKGMTPAVNVVENNDEYEIAFAVPGMSKSDFVINLDNNVLTVKSEKEVDNETENINYTRKEFSFTSFQRSFTLPESVNGEEIKAGYKDGILSINIPKREEAKIKPVREIQIV